MAGRGRGGRRPAGRPRRRAPPRGGDGTTAGGRVEYDGPLVRPGGELYEVWFVAAGDTPDAPARSSAGTFHPAPDGRSDVRFAAAVDPARYPVVEITAEPGDGNPLPTGPVVLRATIGS